MADPHLIPQSEDEPAIAFVLVDPLEGVALLDAHRAFEVGASPPSAKAHSALRVRRSLSRRLGAPREGAWSLDASESSIVVRLDARFVGVAFDAVLDVAGEEGLTVWDSEARELVVPFPRAGPVRKLAEALAWLSALEDGWIVCEGGPDLAYYVQLFALGDGRARLEAVAGRHLPAGHELPPALDAKLALHGLRSSAESAPNLSCVVDLTGPRAPEAVAEQALLVLEDVYGVPLRSPSRIRLWRHA